MIESLPEDYEIHISSCNKLTHRWHVVLMEGNEEIKNIKSMTLGYGLGILEEYLTGEVFLKRIGYKLDKDFWLNKWKQMMCNKVK